ncbi:MAG: hypothetical protein WBM16_11585 [Pseudolabrys sp.]
MTIKNLAYATVVAVAAVAFVIGSAVPSEAAKKKKAAAAAPPPPQQPTCLLNPQGKVCATKGDMKFTYFNACYAMKDGAKSATSGECKPAKAAKGGGKKAKKKK